MCIHDNNDIKNKGIPIYGEPDDTITHTKRRMLVMPEKNRR
jgi:glycerol-3-phosphate cytidylyltransferase-like family protein